jgi:hypothetical protein
MRQSRVNDSIGKTCMKGSANKLEFYQQKAMQNNKTCINHQVASTEDFTETHKLGIRPFAETESGNVSIRFMHPYFILSFV